MKFETITKDQQDQFDAVATHPLQAYAWGEFREKTGVKVIRRGLFDGKKLTKSFQLTIHKIPHTPWNIGYLPKGYLPDEVLLKALQIIGKQEKCIFIQIEPNIEKFPISKDYKLLPSAHPLFTKYTFQLDLTKREDELLKNMHPKTRYNIRVAQKHGVRIIEDNSDEAFETYWQLMDETTTRQKFFAHTKQYHRFMWESLRNKNQGLKAHLFLAKYNPPDQKETTILVAWVLFTLHDTLYYPYGASSNQYKNVMASNLMMWEAILFGKKLGLKTFDMWGSMGPEPDTTDPWYGFHRLKQGYGPRLVEFVGSYDLIINPTLYPLYKGADKLRWIMLRLKNR